VKVPRGQIAHFRIRPEPSKRFFFHVRVFSTVAHMHHYLRYGPIPRQPGRFCKGICSTYSTQRRQGGRWRTTPEMGEIVFALRWLGAGVIAHECTHAALHWAERRGHDVKDRGRGRFIGGGEEPFCGALGEMARQIARYLWAHELVK
jgi:hypothetical protein